MTRRTAPFVACAMAADELLALVDLYESGAPRAFSGADAAPEGNRGYALQNGVALVPLAGPLVGRAGPCDFLTGAQSYGGFVEALHAAAADPGTRRVQLRVKTPGGEVQGAHEAAEAVYALRGRMPVEAWVEQATSAGYWIASAADRIVASPTAVVGGIGVYGTHEDDTARQEKEGVKRTLIASEQFPLKAATPSTEAGRASAQQIVNDLAAVFAADVARYRGVTVDQVVAGYGHGSGMVAGRALEAGLIDAITGPHGHPDSPFTRPGVGRASQEDTLDGNSSQSAHRPAGSGSPGGDFTERVSVRQDELTSLRARAARADDLEARLALVTQERDTARAERDQARASAGDTALKAALEKRDAMFAGHVKRFSLPPADHDQMVAAYEGMDARQVEAQTVRDNLVLRTIPDGAHKPGAGGIGGEGNPGAKIGSREELHQRIQALVGQPNPRGGIHDYVSAHAEVQAELKAAAQGVH